MLFRSNVPDVKYVEALGLYIRYDTWSISSKPFGSFTNTIMESTIVYFPFDINMESVSKLKVVSCKEEDVTRGGESAVSIVTLFSFSQERNKSANRKESIIDTNLFI